MLNITIEVFRKIKGFQSVVSLENKNAFLNYPELLKKLRISIFFLIVITLFFSLTLNNSIAILILWILSFAIAIKQYGWIKKLDIGFKERLIMT